MRSTVAGSAFSGARLITLAAFAFAACVFLVIEFVFPRFPEIDEAFFKSAGRNLGEGHGFAAPELEGFLHLRPPPERVFFAHPPLYPWLFGQVVKVFGFGWQSCVGYDAVISILLSFLVFCVATYWIGLLTSSERWTAAALAPALCTLLLRQPARPDELGMMIAYANLWLLTTQRVTVGIASISGCLAGFTLCTSTGVMIGFLPLLATSFISRANWSDVPRKLSAAAGGAAVAVALCLLPLYFKEHTFYRQFFQHADTVVAGSPIHRVISETALLWHVAPFRLWALIATLPACGLGLISWSRQSGRTERALLYFAPLIGFLLLALLRSAFTYWWFLEPYFIIGAVAGLTRGRNRAVTITSAAWLALGLGCALLWPIKGYFARITLPYEQQLGPSQERLRQIIPPGAAVLTSYGWWTLAGDHHVIDPTFSNITNVERIDFFVAGNNGTGAPGTWTKPAVSRYADWLTTDFEVVRDDLPREPLRVCGLRISRSAYGFGSVIMRRKSFSILDPSAAGDDHARP